MYFVKQFGYEVCDSEPYFTDFMESFPEIIIDGGRGYKSFNADTLERIKSAINDYYIYEFHYNYYSSFLDYLTQYLPKKVNGKQYSGHEIKRIKKAFDTDKDELIIITVLSIIYGKRYILTWLNGCCQGDCVKCYLPDEMPNNIISELEALFWNTGSEVVIDDSGRENIENAEDIDGYSAYITDWNTKRGVAEMLGCDESEIVLFEFDGYKHVPTYKRV